VLQTENVLHLDGLMRKIHKALLSILTRKLNIWLCSDSKNRDKAVHDSCLVVFLSGVVYLFTCTLESMHRLQWRRSTVLAYMNNIIHC